MNVKIMACGDLHLRATKPKMRTDDFLATQEKKLQQIIDIAREEVCDYIIFPGDVFHKHDASHGLVEMAIRIFNQFSGDFLFVFGQHDLRYHTSDKKNTPLGVLVAALGVSTSVLDSQPLDMGNLSFYGASWGEEIPKIKNQKCTNFLVIHRPVTIEPLPWESPELITASQLFASCPADIFITGDNHKRFIAREGKRLMINMGSVTRTNSDQCNHKPAVSIIAIDDDGIEIQEINLAVDNDIFDLEKIDEQKSLDSKHDEQLKKLTQSLTKDFDAKLCFIDNIRKAADKSDSGVKEILSEVLAV